MSNIKKLYANFIRIAKYSDTDLLEIVMNLIVVVLNPLKFSAIHGEYPMWLLFVGIPFGLFSIYKILTRCSKGRDLSYLLTIGQLVGITILAFDEKSLFYPLVFELLVFSFLRWRASNDVKRKRGIE